MRQFGWLVLSALALASGTARAGVTITLDVEAFNALLPSLAPREVVVSMGAGQSLTIQLENFKVTGFEPAAAAGGTSHVLTSVQARVPQLGINAALQPKLSVRLVGEGAQSMIELRFEQVPLALPLAGSVNLASFLEPIRFPAEDVFVAAGPAGPVNVRSRLTGIKMDRQQLHLDLNLRVVPPSAP